MEYYGDIFKNINNSTVVTKSKVENAFNEIEVAKDLPTAKRFARAVMLIEDSGDNESKALLKQYVQEVNNPEAESITLSKIWSKIESIPAIKSNL